LGGWIDGWLGGWMVEVEPLLCIAYSNQKDYTDSANVHLLKFLILFHIFGQSAKVKIDFNKLL
jgi:hypothetical protein